MKKGQVERARTMENSSLPKSSGHLFIISAPSGAGKSTLCRAMLDHFADLLYSISYTTRPPRQGEQNGVDYYFIPKDEFKKGISRHQWAEWAEVHGNYYGTSAEFLDKKLSAGRDILLDIDVQGTRQILKRYPGSITIFIMPPTLEILKQRLEDRGTDSPQVIAVRLDNAQKEMAQKAIYRHVVINDRLLDATAEMIAIFENYRS
ncbi:MAG: guanylate kinase [Desulfobacteraceae bacterium]|jgi:guanylate kinase|nr:guanylate kinase [Desulfobacteraceae bacterium]